MRSMGPEQARDIVETFLDITCSALLSRDFDSFAAVHALPHTIETPDMTTVVKTTAAMRPLFDRVCSYYESHNVTDLVRLIETAEFRGPNRIESLRVTHLMAGSHRIQDPYPSFNVLERFGEVWMLTSTQYAVDSSNVVSRALLMGRPDPLDNPTFPTPGKPTKKEFKQ